ncbi:hypothetical protein DFJ58DRAFT_731230 [Suillus subalutaceus]|uniref:uncharacterized protein n=1 Tax=Suillus subalutaceus TaxID=48586 RepID=UPI001B85F780|nr:uncharacterized protein DFJ58DRAFT_731230 [Suillus subalutaceus]KAG1844313.1 hypothetical protein DFJ58DRAFT_731230 [Suillus subalutaceus]
MSGLAALHCSTFAQGFSNNQRQAAARALLRHDAHIDGTHYHTKTLCGLHPSYIAFHSNGQELESGRALSPKELIAMQDHLDGGISLLVRCAGSGVGPTMSPEKIPLDLYITPCELQEVPQQIGGDVVVLVQAFAQEFAIPHLQRFAKRCAIENIKPPQSFPATHISTNGPQHLPGPIVATGARIACSAQAPKTFEKNLQTSSVPAADPKKPASAAISEGIQLGASVAKDMLTPRSQIRWRRAAEVFVADRVPGPIFLVRPEFGYNAINFSPPLISIGPNTDAALDRFKLGDELLPKLRVLVGTVQSSRWELVLRSQKWDLSYEQASILANALLADLQGVPFSPEIVKRKSSVLSVILKCLGILIVNNYLAVFHRGIMSKHKYMVSPSTHKSSARRRMQQPRIHPKVVISKEAHALLTANQRTKSRQFKIALDEAWGQIDEATKTIASAHHKSIRRASENRNQGKGALQQLVHEHKDEYHNLSKDERADLLKEYADWSLTKATGVCTSTKSKVNDITQTLKAVEIELKSLQCRTGAESIFYTTRGSTDLPLRSIAFATEGVQDFMPSVMGVDNQDLLGKMEGFAVQGVKGAAQNHQERVSQARAAIRNIINSTLRQITGNPDANMQWALYFRNIIQRYQVMIEGWPDNIPFANLSQVSSALPELDRLFRRWKSGATHWKTLTDKEFEKVLQEHNDKLDHGEIDDHRRRTRSDKGKKRKKPTAMDSSLCGRKKYKSAATVEDSDKENDAEEEDNDKHEARGQSSAPSGAPSCHASNATPAPSGAPSGAPSHTPSGAPSGAPSCQLSDTTSNATPAPHVSRDTCFSTPSPHFSNDSDTNSALLDCDAMLDRLGEIFGSTHQDETTMSMIAP